MINYYNFVTISHIYGRGTLFLFFLSDGGFFSGVEISNLLVFRQLLYWSKQRKVFRFALQVVFWNFEETNIITGLQVLIEVGCSSQNKVWPKGVSSSTQFCFVYWLLTFSIWQILIWFLSIKCYVLLKNFIFPTAGLTSFDFGTNYSLISVFAKALRFLFVYFSQIRELPDF